ncbi:MAG: O-antigen ligase family protein, partial [Bryobacteraceae bacterium]
MGLLLSVVAALASLLILPGWFFYFDIVPKVAVVLFGAAVALPFLNLRANRSRAGKFFLWLISAQAAAIVLATLFSTHRWLSFFGSAWRREGAPTEIAILILAASAAIWLPARGNPRLFLRITVFAAVPAAIYGILQYFGIDPILPPASYHFGEGRFMIVRPPSTLGHASYFATYLLFVTFAAGALAKLESSRAWKIAAMTVSVLAIFAIVLSGTRAALLGLLVGAAFIAARRGFNRRWLIASALVAVVFAGFYFSPAGARLRARVFWSSEDLLGGARLPLWRDTLAMSSSRLETGYGPETFTPEFPHHESIRLARAFPD